jgi:putative nucleotidyltransferase with HDIG domain
MQARSSDTTWRHFEWKHEGTEYLASYRKVFLKYRFLAPAWTVVLSQSKAHVLAPMANFKRIFHLVVLMSLWVVLLLSSIHIRRSLVPLEKLKEGTYRIARRDFDSRVTVTSGDEFEELAASFNTMSGQLGRQFKALTTIGEIDRAILSALETDKIVQTLLARMPDVLSCDAVSVGLMDSNQINTARTYVSKGNAGSEKPVEAIELTPEEVRSLFDNPQHLFIDGDGNTPHYVAPLAREGIKSFLVLPIFLNEKLSGIITIGYAGSPAHGSDETKAASTEFGETVSQARQLADQVAVALSNAHLIEELDRLNWGTLTALARAVDAKSPWTAGHSERVTNLALEIGQVLGLAPKDLDVLRRAALLHDVGKIGIPMAILDKPKKLSEEECELMKQHTRMGGRILEPISAYADVLPIVLQHHERLNGIGYPDGLSGKAICLGARILAVADVFDAMVSDRPYRAGWDQEHVLEHIKQGAGQQFDLDVVKALLKVAGSEGRAPHESSLFRLNKLNKLNKADDTGSGEKDYPIRPGAGHQVT